VSERPPGAPWGVADAPARAAAARSPRHGRELSPRLLDDMAAAFHTIARLLLEAPTAELVDELRKPRTLLEWPLPTSIVTQRGLELLERSSLLEEPHHAVVRDYHELFVGPGKALAPPYESVHRSTEGLLFEDETVQVRAFYARAGLEVPRLGRDPDDHIGLECSFVAALAISALQADEAGETVARADAVDTLTDFLEAHLLAWGPDLMVLIGERAETSFYQGVSALGFGALEHVAERVCGRALHG